MKNSQRNLTQLLFSKPVAEVYDVFAWPHVYLASSLITQDIGEVDEILEIGCGTGLATVALAKVASKVVAFDSSDAMLEKASYRMRQEGIEDKVTLLRQHADEFSFGSNRFDAVVMTYVLRHIKPESLNQVVSKIAEALRPQGGFFAADFHLPLMGAFPKGVSQTNPNYLILGVMAIYEPASLAHYLESYHLQNEWLHYYPFSFIMKSVKTT